MSKSRSRILWIVLVGMIGLAACATSETRQRELDRSVLAAEATLLRMQSDSRRDVFRNNLRKAKAVVIFSPGFERGVVLARTAGAQGWSGPAFYNIVTLDAGSGRMGTTGLRAGKQNLELVLLAMSDKALDWIMSPRLPGMHNLAVFPVTSAASSALDSSADVFVFSSKAGGQGIEIIGGPLISIDKAANQSYYGRPATPADILVQHSVTSPEVAQLQKAISAAE